MGLKETLDLLMQYPRIKSISVTNDSGLVRHVELFPPAPVQPQVQPQVVPSADDMPPDDVMMFASTPTFNDMVDAAKASE